MARVRPPTSNSEVALLRMHREAIRANISVQATVMTLVHRPPGPAGATGDLIGGVRELTDALKDIAHVRPSTLFGTRRGQLV